ncbi:hypothetical protein ACHAXN_009302 [Cyclotella atomus]
MHARTFLLLTILPTASCLLAPLGLKRKWSQTMKPPLPRRVNTHLSLGIDPSELASQHIHNPGLLDIVSTSFHPGPIINIATPLPNQSLAPMAETLRLNEGAVTIIPDQIALPGGLPRSGNSFIVESFREVFNGPVKASTSPLSIPLDNDGGSTPTIFVPTKEFDVVGRYADLLNRVPLAAAIYALVDFFFVNAEEDVAIAEILDDAEGDEIMEMEATVVKDRFLGLFVTVLATVVVSSLVYHPVPFNQL